MSRAAFFRILRIASDAPVKFLSTYAGLQIHISVKNIKLTIRSFKVTSLIDSAIFNVFMIQNLTTPDCSITSLYSSVFKD
jgi:hypothetical protein